MKQFFSQNGWMPIIKSKPVKPAKFEPPRLIQMIDIIVYSGLILVLGWIVIYLAGLDSILEWFTWIINYL